MKLGKQTDATTKERTSADQKVEIFSLRLFSKPSPSISQLSFDEVNPLVFESTLGSIKLTGVCIASHLIIRLRGDPQQNEPHLYYSLMVTDETLSMPLNKYFQNVQSFARFIVERN